MRIFITVALALIWVGTIEGARAQSQSDWVLMSREGECVEIASAQRRRFSELPPIASPEQFADEWRRRGAGVTATPFPGTRGEVVLVEVPSQRLSLMFAQRARCANVAPRR